MHFETEKKDIMKRIGNPKLTKLLFENSSKKLKQIRLIDCLLIHFKIAPQTTVFKTLDQNMLILLLISL